MFFRFALKFLPAKKLSVKEAKDYEEVTPKLIANNLVQGT
jgi:hypothetical protein